MKKIVLFLIVGAVVAAPCIYDAVHGERSGGAALRQHPNLLSMQHDLARDDGLARRGVLVRRGQREAA
jgi:hypothetical protein